MTNMKSQIIIALAGLAMATTGFAASAQAQDGADHHADRPMDGHRDDHMDGHMDRHHHMQHCHMERHHHHNVRVCR